MPIPAEMTRAVIDSFTEARNSIMSTFRATSCPDIVTAARKREIPRNGTCLNGWEYSIHGVGFTVTLPPKGQAHFDGSNQGDYFTDYDVQFFIETSELLNEAGLAEVVESLNNLSDQKIIRHLDDGRYSLAAQP